MTLAFKPVHLELTSRLAQEEKCKLSVIYTLHSIMFK